MDYFRVSIAGSDAVYQEVGESVRFTDEFGITVDSPPEPIAYLSRSWEYPAWAEPLPVVAGPRRHTKLSFVGLLGDSFSDILAASKVSVEVEMFVRMLDWATPDPDGTSVDLDDQRVIGALMKLEAAGVLPPGKAQEVLNA